MPSDVTPEMQRAAQSKAGEFGIQLADFTAYSIVAAALATRIGEYRADYSEPTRAEIDASDPEMDELLKNSKVVTRSEPATGGDGWRRIVDGLPHEWPTEVDVWMDVYASPRSFGMSDSFRVPNAYRRDGKWFHQHESREAELVADYITHWRPLPAPPAAQQQKG